MRQFLVLFAVLSFAGCGNQTQHNVRSSTTASSAPAATAGTQPPSVTADPVDFDAVGRSAASAVRDFYDAVARQDYAAAWAREASAHRRTLGGYDTWKAGYRTTTGLSLASVTPTATDQSHARVRLVLRATDRDVCGATVRQRFSGTLDLRRWQGRWQITDSAIIKTAGGTVRTDRGSCPQSDSNQAAVAAGTSTSQASAPHTPSTTQTNVCYPSVDLQAVDLPAVDLPAVTLPAVDLPAVDIGDQHIPSRHIPARHMPGRHIPGRHIPGRHIAGGCLEAPAAFAPTKTSVLENGYDHLDAGYSPTLTSSYWSRAGTATSYPDPTASGFGEFNAAGFPKNQYVRPYMRRNGTMVSGYWRNSPSDGLPTCRIITC